MEYHFVDVNEINEDVMIDPLKVFVLSAAVELQEIIEVDFQKLVDFVASDNIITSEVYGEWYRWGDRKDYARGISGDTLLRENFFDAIAKTVTQKRYSKWPSYGWTDEAKREFKEVFKESVKQKFDYDLDDNFI